MQAHQTDLLYRVRLANGGQAYIYFLFEHKSYPDPLVALQLLRYMVRFWERQVKENDSLAPVIPLVIYHGEKAWRGPTEFLALLDPPEALRPYLPSFRYHLSDFSPLSDEAIRGEIWLQVSLGDHAGHIQSAAARGIGRFAGIGVPVGGAADGTGIYPHNFVLFE